MQKKKLVWQSMWQKNCGRFSKISVKLLSSFPKKTVHIVPETALFIYIFKAKCHQTYCLLHIVVFYFEVEILNLIIFKSSLIYCKVLYNKQYKLLILIYTHSIYKPIQFPSAYAQQIGHIWIELYFFPLRTLYLFLFSPILRMYFKFKRGLLSARPHTSISIRPMTQHITVQNNIKCRIDITVIGQ